jgi:hypothetical protein
MVLYPVIPLIYRASKIEYLIEAHFWFVVKKSSTAQKYTEGLQLSTFLNVSQVKVMCGQSSLGFVGRKLHYGLVFIMPYTITEVYAWNIWDLVRK